MSEPENFTHVLLREMRAEQQAFREEVNARFEQVDAQFAEMRARLDKLHANGLKALQGFIGHRAMVERTMGSFERTMVSFEDELAQLKRRVERLEAAET